MKTIIIKMTDAYDYQSFYETIENCTMIDCRDLEGTRCYLDDSAKSILVDRLNEYSAEGIHFIDSGNYHYLSLLWLQKITTPFNLVLFDHHPDNQPPSFGEITSCGGWVLEATETLPNLKNVFTYGVGDETPIDNIPTDLPIYISIDKDALSTEFAITDWDQGNMTLDELLKDLESLYSSHQIIGVDICGDSGENAENGGKVNNQTNHSLFDFLSKKF